MAGNWFNLGMYQNSCKPELAGDYHFWGHKNAEACKSEKAPKRPSAGHPKNHRALQVAFKKAPKRVPWETTRPYSLRSRKRQTPAQASCEASFRDIGSRQQIHN